METAAAILQIATSDPEAVVPGLREHIAQYLTSGRRMDFFDWLRRYRQIPEGPLALLRGRLQASVFECPACARMFMGADLGVGAQLACPRCSCSALKIVRSGSESGSSDDDGLAAQATRVAVPRFQFPDVFAASTSSDELTDDDRAVAAAVTRIFAPPAEPAAPDLPVAGDQGPAMRHADDDANEWVVEPRGRWTVVGMVGSGGAGDVWKAYNEVLDQHTAVKVLTLDDPLSAVRFRREARVYGRLDHPHIVRVRDMGQFRGRPAIMLEWVDGGSLQDALNRGTRFSVCDVVKIGRDVADALAAAHALHIVHRDVKPANLLRTSDGCVKVSDFGLALVGNSRLTAAGVILGTPTHISPEQVTSGTATEASDIYSLGATLYHLLAGRPPYSDLSAAAMMAAHATRPFPLLRDVCERTPEELDQLVQRMTARNPDDRPAAKEVCKRLGSLASRMTLPGLTRTRPRVEVCRFDAPLDAEGWAEVGDAICRRVSDGVTRLVLDLTACSAGLSMAGVRVLEGVAERVGRDVMIALITTDARIPILLDIVGAVNLRAYSTLAEAAAELREPEDAPVLAQNRGPNGR